MNFGSGPGVIAEACHGPAFLSRTHRRLARALLLLTLCGRCSHGMPAPLPRACRHRILRRSGLHRVNAPACDPPRCTGGQAGLPACHWLQGQSLQVVGGRQACLRSCRRRCWPSGRAPPLCCAWMCSRCCTARQRQRRPFCTSAPRAWTPRWLQRSAWAAPAGARPAALRPAAAAAKQGQPPWLPCCAAAAWRCSSGCQPWAPACGPLRRRGRPVQRPRWGPVTCRLTWLAPLWEVRLALLHASCLPACVAARVPCRSYPCPGSGYLPSKERTSPSRHMPHSVESNQSTLQCSAARGACGMEPGPGACAAGGRVVPRVCAARRVGRRCAGRVQACQRRRRRRRRRSGGGGAGAAAGGARAVGGGPPAVPAAGTVLRRGPSTVSGLSHMHALVHSM